MAKESAFSSKKLSTAKVKKNSKKSNSIKTQKTTKKNNSFDNQDIKIALKSFYDHEAKKYAETRKKFRHEEEHILKALTPIFLKKEKINILEFWCGSGRFASLLNKNFPNKFEYIWIDLSEELIWYAIKDNPHLNFIVWDITKLIKDFDQESFDLIVWTSSFQHIPTKKERSFLMKNFYRLLKYDWTILMTNRSLSSWFRKKNIQAVRKAKIQSIISLDKSKTHDILVPWTNHNGKVYDRFYHFFTLKELEHLSIFSGFTIKINSYIDGNGEFTDNEKLSRSSLFIGLKSPIKE